MDYTADEVREALAPLSSLLSKSEKAQQKVAAGTWQYTMLESNIKALQVALALIDGTSDQSDVTGGADLEEALLALESMIERVENTQTKFPPGTSQHSLQRNRLKALHIARSAVMANLDAR